jgi:hypothetical protein
MSDSILDIKSDKNWHVHKETHGGCREDIKALRLIDKFGKRGPGGIVCSYDSLLSLDDSNKIMPIGMN